MNTLVIVENVLQALTAGLLIGSVYALMCVGLGLIYDAALVAVGAAVMIVGLYLWVLEPATED